MQLYYFFKTKVEVQIQGIGRIRKFSNEKKKIMKAKKSTTYDISGI